MADQDPIGNLFKNASGKVKVGGFSFDFGQQPVEEHRLLETMTLEELERTAAGLALDLKLVRNELKRRKPAV